MRAKRKPLTSDNAYILYLSDELRRINNRINELGIRVGVLENPPKKDDIPWQPKVGDLVWSRHNGHVGVIRGMRASIPPLVLVEWQTGVASWLENSVLAPCRLV